MGNTQMREYEKELHHRLLEAGIDATFIEAFFERHRGHIEDDLRHAADESPAYYEDALQTWVDMAKEDYNHYGAEWFSHVQEGYIPPKKTAKKKRRASKAKDIVGALERQAALGRYLARVASEFETIISFRKNVMSGRVLSEEETLTFLLSPVAAAKSRDDFKMLGANPLNQILDTNYQVKEDEDDSGPYRKLVWRSGHSHTIRPLDAIGRKRVFPGDVVTNHDLPGFQLRANRAVILPHPREKGRVVLARPQSIIGDAVRLAEVSLGGFPISKEDGVWFILTGEFIPENPVRIRYETTHRPYLLSRTTITLEVESWLPPEEVLEQYRHAQHQILGGTPRSLKRRTVGLFEFVNQHKGKTWRTWREIFDAWNKAHSSQRFRDRSHLYTTYKRALAAIVSPPTLAELSLTPTARHRPQ